MSKNRTGKRKELKVNLLSLPKSIEQQQKERWRSVSVPGRPLGWEWKQQGQHTLVIPSAKAHWSATTPLWRSVLLRGEEVISVGLPKFWDPEDSPQNVQYLEEITKQGEPLVATIKYDGKLLIRSVHKGKIRWRTRTNFTLDDALLQPVEGLLQNFPLLNDPDWQKDLSLHFELCLQGQRIIVAYEKDFLILVGASENKTLAPLAWSSVEAIAQEAKIDCAWQIPLKGKTLVAWQEEVEAQKNNIGEGVVIRDPAGFPCLRLKSSFYQQTFRLRYKYPPGAIYRALMRELQRARNRGKALPDVIAAVFQSLQVEAEDKHLVQETANLFLSTQEDCLKRIEELKEVVTEAKTTTTRGVFAKEIAQSYPLLEGPILLKIWDGNSQEGESNLLAYMINRLCESLDQKISIPFSGNKIGGNQS